MGNGTSQTSRQHSTSAALPAWARAADVATVALLLGALVVLYTGGVSARPFGVRISAHSPTRSFGLAIVLLLIRHWRIRRPTLWQRVEAAIRRIPESSTTALPQADEMKVAPPRARERGLITWGRRLRASPFMQLAAVSLFFTAIVTAATYPQIARLDSVSDPGDPLFSTWRLAWIAHQLPRDPLHLFDANTFYPERRTLTHSDSMIVPGLMAAPLLWLGVHPLYVCNLMLLAAAIFSGIAMFQLIRALTGRPEAGLIAGTIFALYPYRFEHYSHLELQITFWMPLLLLAVHRVFARGNRGDGLLFGLLIACQALSSLYYGAFLIVYLVPIGLLLFVQSRARKQAIMSLGIGVAIAAILVAPTAAAYVANRSLVGERDAAAVRYHSAAAQDYLKPHGRNIYYGLWDAGPHQAERELFPTISPVGLSLVAMWPPLSAARMGYAVALAVSFEASRGTNGALFRALREYVPLYRGLRVPARFSIMVGLALSILAGYGTARLVRSRHRPIRFLVTAALLGIALVELTPRLHLVRVWLAPPAIYQSLAGRDDVVLAEFPMPKPRHPNDARGPYFSVFHWHKLVTGISGHYSQSYIQLLRDVRNFPDDASMDALRGRGVTHLVVHGASYKPRRLRRLIRALKKRPDVELVDTAPFDGGRSRLYELRR